MKRHVDGPQQLVVLLSIDSLLLSTVGILVLPVAVCHDSSSSSSNNTMRHIALLSVFLAVVLNTSPGLASNYARQPGKDAILLSNVQTLTLRGNRLTTSRRLPPVPQLTCTGPSKRICESYTLETMRCTNAGFDYDEEDVQWTCTAPLPPEFKLGSTDVVCEGYRSADDKWVLKGSCGVEYRLLLTDLGEDRFGKMVSDGWYLSDIGGWRGVSIVLGNLIFFGFIVAVFFLILWPMLLNCLGLRRNRPGPGGDARGFGGGGGGGGGGPGGGGGGGYPGPPPPYSAYPDSSNMDSSGSFSSSGWRPGFWTGALGGAAAGYQFGRRNQARDSPFANRRAASGRFQGFRDPGEGSSRFRSSPGSGFSATSTGTGFGSSRRR